MRKRTLLLIAAAVLALALIAAPEALADLDAGRVRGRAILVP